MMAWYCVLLASQASWVVSELLIYSVDIGPTYNSTFVSQLLGTPIIGGGVKYCVSVEVD
jgi:hypothetical protein